MVTRTEMVLNLLAELQAILRCPAPTPANWARAEELWLEARVVRAQRTSTENLPHLFQRQAE